MAEEIVEALIQESMKNVAGVDGRKATDTDKILVVIASRFPGEKSIRSKAVEAAVPVGGVSVVIGAVVGLAQVFGLG